MKGTKQIGSRGRNAAMLAACGLLAAGLAQPLFAAERSSVNYAITVDSLDNGGLPTASAQYAHHGSLGGFGGTSTATRGPLVAKHGYIGQFRDLARLAITVQPTNVEETGSFQLGVDLMYDDQTLSPLDSALVDWSVVSGPVASISAAGQGMAGTVYADTPAQVQGQYLGRQGLVDLLVLDLDHDNFGAYAQDHIDDDWQVFYFGLNNPLGFPAADSDGDQQSNWFEFIAGLVPTNSASRFRFSIANVAGFPTQKRIQFSPRFEDRSYRVEYQPDSLADSYRTLPGGLTEDNGVERTVIDPNATNALRFYRVNIAIP